jgi:hypothetical protein
MIFWVPQSGRLGLGLSLLTYQGSVTLGVVSDAGLVPDPGAIVQGFQDEWEQFLKTLPPAARAPASSGEIASGRSRRRKRKSSAGEPRPPIIPTGEHR